MTRTPTYMSTLKPSFDTTPGVANADTSGRAEKQRTDRFKFSGLSKAAAALSLALAAEGCAVSAIDAGLLDPSRGIIDANAARMDYNARQHMANEARRHTAEQPAETGPMSRQEATTRFNELRTTLHGEMTHPVMHAESIGEFTGGRELFSSAVLGRLSASEQGHRDEAQLSRALRVMTDPATPETAFSVRCVEGNVTLTTRGMNSLDENREEARMCRIRAVDPIYQTLDHDTTPPEMRRLAFSHRVAGLGTNREEAARQAFANLSDQMGHFAHHTDQQTAYGNVMQQRTYAFDYHTTSTVFQLGRLQVNYTEHPESHTVEAELSATIKVNVPATSLQGAEPARMAEALNHRAHEQETEELEDIRRRLAAAQSTLGAQPTSSRSHRHGHHSSRGSLVPSPFEPSSARAPDSLMPVPFNDEPASSSSGSHRGHRSHRRHGSS